MLIYDKNGTLFGTLGQLPRQDDVELTYLDENGEKLSLAQYDVYWDNKNGGIIRQSDGKTVNVFIEDVRVIPPGQDIPKIPVLKKSSDYLYEVTFDDLDYEFADKYFKEDTDTHLAINKPGLCTSVWKDGKLYRNYDLSYNYDVAFAVHVSEKVDDSFVHGKRFASSGTADSIPRLDVSFIKSQQYTSMYKLIPFRVVDGVNENKVAVSINVVPKQKGDTTKTIPEIEEHHEIQASALVRFILDNFESATEAIDYTKKYVSVYPNSELAKLNYDIHYLIADRNNAYIMEVIDNKLVSIEVSEMSNIKPIITNFHVISDISGNPISLDNGHVYTPATAPDGKLPSSQGLTSHADGLERYNIIVDNYDDLSNFRNLVLYNQAYTEVENPWYSEFAGVYSDTLELTVDSTPEEYEATVMPYVRDMYKHRSRDTADTWHTTHTAIYDLDTMTYNIVDSSESGIEYKFNI